MNANAGRLLGVDSRDDAAMADGARALNQIGEDRAPDAAAVQIVADVHRVLDREPIRASPAEFVQGSPANEFAVEHGDGDWMPLAVAAEEPLSPLLDRLGLFLICAGGGVDVVVVNVVDRGEVGFRRETDGRSAHGCVGSPSSAITCPGVFRPRGVRSKSASKLTRVRSSRSAATY